MLYRPYQRAEHAKAPKFCDLNEELSNRALKSHRKPLQKSKKQKIEIFPTKSEFIGAYRDLYSWRGWFGKT